MQETRDVIILFVAGEQTFGVPMVEIEGRKCNGYAESTGCGNIAVD
jgi:hypothetical protein